jgi:6-pyruvoyltetrahydropterin/6-carboxytetrahydropterin synthase
MVVFKAFHIDAAHRLSGVPPSHKCFAVHGHSFRTEVHVRGPVKAPEGWVLDFADIAEAFRPAQERLDHHLLNDIPGLENPTSENLARWIWKVLSPRLGGLCKIVVQESPDSGCVYEGEED